MPRQSPKPNAGGADALTVTLAGLLLLVAVAACQVYWTAGAVIDAAQDRDTYALFITDAGIASDNAAMEERVNDGLAALRGARQLSLALLVGVCGLGAALAYRVWGKVGTKPV